MKMSLDQIIEKPKRPSYDDYDLDFQKLKSLKYFKSQCEQKRNSYSQIICGLIIIISCIPLFIYELHKGLIIPIVIGSVLLTYIVIPYIFKVIVRIEIADFIFEKTKDSSFAKIDHDNKLFEAAMALYKPKNDMYERAVMRTTWQYWLSLTPVDFENAVGELFLDKGYEVWTTKASGDHGVDLFLERDGKKYVVQCKTYKKVLGPNVARDLYGTMMSEGANEAFLAAPSGFSAATIEFCKGKPIKLLGIDELTKMTYNFENYTPYYLANAKSMDDVVKGINRNLGTNKFKVKQ